MKQKLNRITFLIGLAFAALLDQILGRRLAINATPLTPTETSHGTESMDADAAIAFKNALVKKGSDDRHFAATAAQADVPFGILLNDEVNSDEAGTVRKNIAVLGLWPDSLPCVSDGAGVIGAGDDIVASVASPGKVRKLPATPGLYIVIGRSRFAVAATANDPVSLEHCTPRAVVVGIDTVGPAQWNVTTANGVIGALAVSNPPTQAEVTAIRDAAETLNDDLLALKVVLNAAGITKN